MTAERGGRGKLKRLWSSRGEETGQVLAGHFRAGKGEQQDRLDSLNHLLPVIARDPRSPLKQLGRLLANVFWSCSVAEQFRH